jgi:hypothetical protein
MLQNTPPQIAVKHAPAKKRRTQATKKKEVPFNLAAYIFS